MKVYEAVLEQLIRSGVTYFAGMVGSTSAPYVGTLAKRNDIRYIAVRHEQVAAALIDATARLTGQPGCVMVHGGSGLMAAGLGIASAALDASPLIILSATQERIAMERGWWQTMNVLKPLDGLAKFQSRVERPDQARAAISQALRESVSGRPGVAQVDIPIDVSVDDIEDAPPPPDVPHRAPLQRPWPDPGKITQAQALIEAAAHPVILVGGGAAYSGAGGALTALAELIHAPVVNTPTSRTVVAETHPLCLGPSGIYGYEPIGRAIAQSDLLLAIGSRLSDLQLSRADLLPDTAAIVQVDIDPAVLGRDHNVSLGVLADARAFTECLTEALARRPTPVPDERRSWVQRLQEDIARWHAAWFDAAPNNGKVQPQELVRTMWDLPQGTIFIHGAGDHGFYAFMVPASAPGAHIVSARLGAMGCGLGSAMGAKLVRPDQPVVACLGDGEFMLQIGDLETMARERLSVVVVVFNNFRLGSQRKRVEAYGPPMGVDHGNPDFAKLAELFGCRGYRVDTPGTFKAALSAALATGEPCVIDVIVDPEARPPRVAISAEAR